MNGCVYRTEDSKCEFYSDYGKGIVSYCDFDDCEEKKPSNADRIRAMTDEELAGWLDQMQTDAYDRGMLEDWIFGYPNNYNNWLGWLKEEVTANDS